MFFDYAAQDLTLRYTEWTSRDNLRKHYPLRLYTELTCRGLSDTQWLAVWCRPGSLVVRLEAYS